MDAIGIARQNQHVIRRRVRGGLTEPLPGRAIAGLVVAGAFAAFSVIALFVLLNAVTGRHSYYRVSISPVSVWLSIALVVAMITGIAIAAYKISLRPLQAVIGLAVVLELISLVSGNVLASMIDVAILVLILVLLSGETVSSYFHRSRIARQKI